MAALLDINRNSIERFEIINPEIPPDTLGDKFCRFDISMIVNGQKVDLEVQVADEGDYPERSLYYWAREFSSAFPDDGSLQKLKLLYADLPRTVIISILAFKMFGCPQYASEYTPLEITRHTALTDKQRLIYYELPKLSKEFTTLSSRKLWLAPVNAKPRKN